MLIHLIFNSFSVNLLVADLEEALQNNLDTEEKVNSFPSHNKKLFILVILQFYNLLMSIFPSPKNFPTYPKSSYIMPHFRRQLQPNFLRPLTVKLRNTL